jgi:RNA polymerase sigma factor (sigma-70 family)
MGIVSLLSGGFPNDVEIIRGVKNHDERYSTLLYNKYRNYCIKCICKMYKQYIDENYAMDIYQDSVIIMYQNILNGRFELRSGTKIETYLMEVCKRQALNHLRAIGKVKLTYAPSEDIDQQLENIDPIEDFERTTIILQELKKMDKKCFDILRLYFFLDKTMENIAVELNYSNANTAKAQKYRCQKYLKEAIITRTTSC